MKHSPGPWTIESKVTEYSTTSHVIRASDGHLVDVMSDFLDPNAEDNAKLVVLAPQMLESLAKLIIAAKQYRESDSVYASTNDQPVALQTLLHEIDEACDLVNHLLD